MTRYASFTRLNWRKCELPLDTHISLADKHPFRHQASVLRSNLGHLGFRIARLDCSDTV